MEDPSIVVFRDESAEGQQDSIGVMLRGVDIAVTADGELASGCSLSPEQAREVARELLSLADEIEG